jgi:serine/threonine protein kinase/WD40 repeat protein
VSSLFLLERCTDVIRRSVTYHPPSEPKLREEKMMMTLATCPISETLSDFAIGKLPSEEFESVSEHLDACSECKSRLERLGTPEDTIIRRLQAVEFQQSMPNEAEFSNAMRHLQSQPVFALERTTAAKPTVPFDIDRFVDRLSESREYDLGESIGQGGMGMVYRAVHRKLRRPVAVKVLPSTDGDDARAVARFEREMAAVARLDHPNIVRAHDAGVVDGTHFLVMELVDGVDLSALLKQRGPLPIADACELIRQAALGLAHAHEHDMIHRDVKPSNLMLTRKGELKILDLGLARLRHSPADEMAAFPASDSEAALDDTKPLHDITVTNHVMGTLDYMSPEQCDDSRDVDGQSDIYSLGATLYKLLTDSSPYAEQSDETFARRYDAIRNGRTVRVALRRPDIPGGLADVIHRMLSRSKEDRFATAQEVATAIAPFCQGADLQCLATGEKRSAAAPECKATPAGSFLGYRGWLAAIACGMLGLAAVAGILATITTPTGELQITVDDAIRDQVSVIATKDGKTVTIAQDDEWTVQLQEGVWNLSVEADDVRAHLDRGRVTIVKKETTVVDVSFLPQKTTGTRPREPVTTDVPDLSDVVEAGGDASPPSSKVVDSQTIITLKEDVGPVAYSPDGKLLATASCKNSWDRPIDTSIYVWSTDDGKLVRTLEGSHHWVHGLAFSPDGSQLATAGFDRTVRLWDLRTPHKPPTVLKDHRNSLYHVAFSPDGRKLASASEDHVVNIWDIGSHQVEHRIVTGSAAYVAEFTPDGRHVISGHWHGTLVVTDVDSGERTLEIQAHKRGIIDLDISPNGKRLATGSFDKTAKLWSLPDGSELASIPAHGHWVSSTRFSPDGKTLVTSGFENGTVRFWDLVSLQKLAEFTPHDIATRMAVYSPDGKYIATGGLDAGVKITPVDTIMP